MLYVHDATNNTMYDTWTADIAEVLVCNNFGGFSIDPEEYYELFTTITYIKLGKNNKSRRIDSKHVFCVTITPKLETFTTKDGKTISYYPATSEIVKDKDHIQQLKRKSKTLQRELINVSRDIRMLPKLSDLPDLDSD